MTRRRWLIVTAAILISAVLAFALRDVIQRTIVLPLLYLLWILGIFYNTIPQFVLWSAMVVLFFLVAMGSLIPKDQFRPMERPKSKPSQGPIEGLAIWMTRGDTGIYYKWLVANRLGKTARELLAQREGRGVSKKFGRLNGRDWNPPQDVDAYLESGLNGSFAEYPQSRRPWSKSKPTPLDLSPQDVVEFLELEMETSLDRHR